MTAADLERLPEITAKASHVMVSERLGKLQRLISITPESGHVVVVEEIRTGRKKLSFLSMQKHPSEDPQKVIRALRAITNQVSVGQTARTDSDQPSDCYVSLQAALVNL